MPLESPGEYGSSGESVFYGDIEDCSVRVQKLLGGIGNPALLHISGQRLSGAFSEHIPDMRQGKAGLAHKFFHEDFLPHTAFHKGAHRPD